MSTICLVWWSDPISAFWGPKRVLSSHGGAVFLLFLHISMTFEVSCLLHYFDVNIIIINIYHLLTSRVIAATHPVSVNKILKILLDYHTPGWVVGLTHCLLIMISLSLSLSLSLSHVCCTTLIWILSYFCHLLTSRVIAATHPVSVKDLKDPVKLSRTWLGGGFDSLLTLQ